MDYVDVEGVDADDQVSSTTASHPDTASPGVMETPSWGISFPSSPVFPEVQPVEMATDEDRSSTERGLGEAAGSDTSGMRAHVKGTGLSNKKCPSLEGVVMSLKEVHVGPHGKRKPKALDMSKVGEALLALPVFKTETFEQGLVDLLAEGRALIGEGVSGQCNQDQFSPPITQSPPALTCTQEPPTFTQLGGQEVTREGASVGGVATQAWAQSRFQYILAAATSPATKVNEETLTYLNQGQSYEVKLKQLGDSTELKGKYVRSVVRVIFHERRLQYMEKEQLESWKATRPGERILDLDIPLSYGILDVKADPHRTNAVEFLWDPTKNAGLYVKVNCISTEFTAKKHGGEKGVPFRIQVESYLADGPGSYKLYHCASCQVKVFKPKGADRKHKTDREKLEKRQASEREIYQPSYECTVLTEIPVEQAENYLSQLSKHQAEEAQKRASAAPIVSKATPPTSKPAIPSPPPIIDNISGLKLSSSSSNLPGQQQQQQQQQQQKSHQKQHKLPRTSPDAASPGAVRNFGCLSDSSQSNDSHSQKAMGSSTPTKSSSAILPKTKARSPKIKAASTPQLPAPEKTIEPLLPEATAQEVTHWLHHNRFSHYVKVFQNFAGADLLRLSRDDLIQICGLADGIRLNNALQAKSVRPKLTIYLCQHKTRPSKDSSSPCSSPSSSQLSASPPHPLISPAHFIPPRVGASLHDTPPAVHTDTAVPTAGKVYIQQSSKRQYRESHDQEEEEEEVYTKKQRTRHVDLTKKGVYHAIYLEHLTHKDLCDKMASLLSVQTPQLKETYVQGPSGIQVLVTDDVVQNFANESRYLIDAFQDEESAQTEYIVHLKSADNKSDA